MHKFNMKKQIRQLYGMTAIGYFQITGASWVALLAARGFSLLEIGVLESIFHMVSMCFEIPSGAVADVFGRKKTLLMSWCVCFLSNILMIFSEGFWSVALAIGFSAFSYNLSSGTREALAYDSLKYAGQEASYDHYASTDMVAFRLSRSTATLCAGLALILGYQMAYTVDLVFCTGAILLTYGLIEVGVQGQEKEKKEGVAERFKVVMEESVHFLIANKKARRIMVVNALVGSVATLVLFFLQAKLPMTDLPSSLLGPALFLMELGAVLGAKLVAHVPKCRYRKLVSFSLIGVGCAFALTFSRKAGVMIAGGFLGALADDFLEVKTDVILNEMIPSEQRATLVSVNSFLFSVVMIGMSTFMGAVMS